MTADEIKIITLTEGLMLLYGVSLNNNMPESIAVPLDKLASEAEAQE